jgi:hypothetical protein
LHFPGNPPGKERSQFFYEADRGTENTTRYKLKLRAHWHFIVKQNRQRTPGRYNVHGIRAVLTESTTNQWAHNLRQAAKEPIVSPRPSTCFGSPPQSCSPNRRLPANAPSPCTCSSPNVIFKRIGASLVDDKFLNLAD